MGHDVTLAHHRCFALPKQGNTWEECEDAFSCNEVAGRFAVADGASESIYAGEWARMLCESFVADPSSEDGVGRWLKLARKRWKASVDGQSVPWHVEEKVRDGACATFLGLTIGPPGDAGRPWKVMAMGDTCMFLVRDNALRRAFPVEKAAGFGARPELLSTQRRRPTRAPALRGTLSAGDRILLMTDAL